MSQRNTSQSLRYGIAREAQLFAEKKWIVGALRKIKTQRNSLQIERLQLESMKASLRQELHAEKHKEKVADNKSPRSAARLMQDSPNIMSAHIIEYEPTPNIEDLEALCNREELNLIVEEPDFLFTIFNLSDKNANPDFGMEEDEEDNEDNEDENCDDVLIDMNMFMNGQP
ncbi:uncharacterized protein ACR2FA_007055 [Aphomia sociella]